MTSKRARGLAIAITVSAVTVLTPIGVSSADPTPTPPPGATPSAVSTAVPTSSPTPVVVPTATPVPTPIPSMSPTPSPSLQREGEEPASVTLAVTSAGGPVADAFYQDLGAYAFAGQVVGVPDGTVVTVSRRSPTGGYRSFVTAVVTGGAYAASIPVRSGGTFVFQSRFEIAGDPSIVAVSPEVTVTVADSGVALDKPVAKIDSLQNPTLTGSVFPARAGVRVNIDVLKGKRYAAVANATTDAAGKFSLPFAYGNGQLTTYSIRSAYHAENSERWEKSGSRSLARIAVINAKVTETTADEVAKTYRKGCPVGKSQLRTVTMNFYGRDKQMHRGAIIIRKDLTPEIIRGFTKALDHRYPVAKMNNPNVYGGNDPKQMEANNTSGFNCRKVVGNPYRQSPHSYGIAIDVNTVQNPYRDSRGKWWPKNGKDYIDRSDKRFGMLFKGSYLTASLRKDHFFWGGFWSPGRDYQHFQYTK